jgi:hypothetical protein
MTLYLADADNSITFDVSEQLSNFFESKVNYFNDHLVIDYNVEDLLLYNITCEGYIDDLLKITYTSTEKYVFNGVLQVGETFNYSEYMFGQTTTGKFLTDINNTGTMVEGDTTVLSFFAGDFGEASNLNNGTLTFYDEDNVVISSDLINQTLSQTSRISNISITAPLNAVKGDILVDLGLNGIFNVYDFIVLPKDNRFQHYLIAWTNSYGTSDYFPFTKNSEETLKIDRDIFPKINNNITENRTFNTNLESNITCYSKFLSQNERLSLRSLWFAPYVASIELDEIIPITVDANSIPIFSRVASTIPIYELEFMYNYKYKIQQR